MKSLAEVAEKWSIDDLLEAHMALDIWDDLEARAHAKAEESARRKQ